MRAGITQRLPRMLGLWLLPLADQEGDILIGEWGGPRKKIGEKIVPFPNLKLPSPILVGGKISSKNWAKLGGPNGGPPNSDAEKEDAELSR